MNSRAAVVRFLLALCLTVATSMTAVAQSTRTAIVRDAEIEQLVKEYAAPILRAAGLSNSGIEIIIVNDPSFNAFVSGRRIFINVGALFQSETPNEIIGVIAHEAGHIAGGHLFRLREQLDRARTMAVLTSLIGMGAVAAAAATGESGLAQAGSGLAAGGGELARRGLLAYQRSEEIAADRSAITYLNATRQSGRGMVRTFERLGGGLSLLSRRPDPYQMSHPLPNERIAALTRLVEESPHRDALDSVELMARHDLARAKIAAYTLGPSAVRRTFTDRSSLPAQYADAILAHLSGSPRDAVAKVDALIKRAPSNAYFHELKGQALLRANQPAEAVAAFRRAISLEPVRSNLIRMALGRALIATGDANGALDVILEGMRYDDRNPSGYQALAMAYGQLGDATRAELATAEMHYHSGNFPLAKQFAARAQLRLPEGGSDWQRAQDILNFQPIR